MKQTPFEQTMNELLRKLEAAVQQRQEAEIQITTNTAAIRALAGTCEDEEEKNEYLAQLEEVSGKPGFKEAVLYALRRQPKGLTPKEIKGWITLSKKMDLSAYSNPLASIHTTLKRMRGSEVEEFVNQKGEKAWRLKPEPTLAEVVTELGKRFSK